MRQNAAEAPEETSVGYYSDNNLAKAPLVVSAAALHREERPQKEQKPIREVNDPQLEFNGLKERAKERQTKDYSLVTQMNACAEELSLRPNTARDKRNVTQYCVS